MKTIKQFLSTTWWVLKIYWKIAPFLSGALFLTEVYLQLSPLIYAYVFGRGVDMIVTAINAHYVEASQLIPIVVIFVSISFFNDFVQLINNRVGAMLSVRDTWSMRQLLADKLISVGVSQLEDASLTNKSTRFLEFIGSLSAHVQMTIGILALVISTFATGATVWHATPVVVPAIFVFFFFKFAVNQHYISKIWKHINETTEGRRSAWSNIGALSDPKQLKELILSNGHIYMKKKYNNFVAGYLTTYWQIYKSWAKLEFVEDIGDAILYAIGLYLIFSHSITSGLTIGTITFLVRAFGNFADNLNSLSYRFSRARESVFRIKDSQEIFEQYTSENDGYKVIFSLKEPSTISFKNVTFHYPSNPREVFKNLNLDIKAGEKIAIVGENGAGKTTLVKLIARVYRPTNGEVEVDGINLNEIKISTWYQKLGLLFQDYNTYENLSVLENVGIGNYQKRKFSSRKVVEALNKAEALDFVQLYKKGLNQILSERYKHGIRPSTGQWQKLALARFFYRNAPVLILDEPTASIDAVSEAKIFNNVYKFMQGKTVIIISHRFSTVRNADRILVLDEGKIVEDGTHEELLKLNGKYAKAFKLQAEGYS